MVHSGESCVRDSALFFVDKSGTTFSSSDGKENVFEKCGMTNKWATGAKVEISPNE
jgi:hypothetical protein